VEDHPDIDWIGNWYVLVNPNTFSLLTSNYSSNELNAAYAADGYARIKETLGVVTTTYAHVLLHPSLS